MQPPGHLMYINKGQDDEMEIFFFKTSKIKIVITYLVTVLTCGILRLIFHWIPHWYIFATCLKCPINEAEKVLIKVKNYKLNFPFFSKSFFRKFSEENIKYTTLKI